MQLENKRIGVGLTGSFCTFEKAFLQMERLIEEGAAVHTVFSDAAQTINSRFGRAEDFLKRAEEMTGHEPMTTIEAAEVIGPTGCLDALVLLPCTGNTMAKLSGGITDTPVLMAAKAQLRNQKPVIIALSTNDALGMNLKNIGHLFNHKYIYFVPFGQDDPEKKPNSMVAHMDLLIPVILKALEGKQYQPIIWNQAE